MQKRRAVVVEMLQNKQESPPAILLNASDSEDAIVDEVFSVSFYFLLPWVSGLMA
jgi:hypothetical protein